MSREDVHGVPPMRDGESEELALADVVAALTAPPSAAELAGEQDALAAFREAVARPTQRRSLRVVARTSVGAGAVVAVLSTGVAAAAAYTAHLPDPVQRVAHHLLGHVGVPAPRSAASPAHGFPRHGLPLSHQQTPTAQRDRPRPTTTHRVGHHSVVQARPHATASAARSASPTPTPSGLLRSGSPAPRLSPSPSRSASPTPTPRPTNTSTAR